MACLISRSVFNITPSAASTNITAPSQILRAAVTSSEKFTCPNQQILLVSLKCTKNKTFYLVYQKYSLNMI